MKKNSKNNCNDKKAKKIVEEGTITKDLDDEELDSNNKLAESNDNSKSDNKNCDKCNNENNCDNDEKE